MMEPDERGQITQEAGVEMRRRGPAYCLKLRVTGTAVTGMILGTATAGWWGATEIGALSAVQAGWLALAAFGIRDLWKTKRKGAARAAAPRSSQATNP